MTTTLHAEVVPQRKRRLPARYVAYGALTAAIAAAVARPPATPPNEFHIPDGITARPPEAELTDGTFTGFADEIPSGPLQVTATVSGGQVTQILVDYPRGERHSRVLNDNAVPQLVDEAFQAQDTRINYVSGATNTSRGFIASLQDAINQSAGYEVHRVHPVAANQ